MISSLRAFAFMISSLRAFASSSFSSFFLISSNFCSCISARVGCFGFAGRNEVIPPLPTMLVGTPSFLAPGMSSLLPLFINLVDDDPECDDPEDGVLATLPPLASTFLIGRTTLPAGALDVFMEGAAELGLFRMVGPLRGGEVTTTSCSETSSAKETPLARDTRFRRSPRLDLLSVVLGGGVCFVVVLDLLSAAGFDGGVLLPVESWGAGNTGSSSSSISLSSVGETASAATDSSTAVLVNGASTVALRCLCLVLVLLDGCGSEVAVF